MRWVERQDPTWRCAVASYMAMISPALSLLRRIKILVCADVGVGDAVDVEAVGNAI